MTAEMTAEMTAGSSVAPRAAQRAVHLVEWKAGLTAPHLVGMRAANSADSTAECSVERLAV